MAEDEKLNNETPEEVTPAEESKTEAGKKKPGRKKADARVEEKIAAAEAKVADVEQKLADVNDRLLRTVAEYDNHRKRSQKEHETAFGNGVCFSAEQLLPVLDTLDCAAKADTTDEEYKKGVLLTLAKCEEVFAKLGITEIEAMGQPFDPELHNAVAQQPAENAESGTVTQVMQKGYRLNGKVIRHAMVAVAP